MILWRISHDSVLSGAGGLYAAGRWHAKGRPIVYCALNPATALLETLVHMEIDAEDRPEHFQLLKIEGPGTMPPEKIVKNLLPRNWANEIHVTQAIGDLWLAEKRHLLLQVPSVLVPETWNVLVNPQHENFGRLKISMIYEHAFDARLLKRFY